MPRSKAPRRAYRPGKVYLNAHHIAMAKVHTLQRDDVAQQLATVEHALSQFTRGVDCAAHWRSLADVANVAEQLGLLGIGSGAQADEVVATAQRVLAEVQLRRRVRGSWTLYAPELDALKWLQALHREQLQKCDYTEYERALAATHEKVSQARAGNAPAGALVIQGDIR